MGLIKQHTMSDSEWARYYIYKSLPTTLFPAYCDTCQALQSFLYKCNDTENCRWCVDKAVQERTLFKLHQGGISGAIDFNKRNFGAKKHKDGSVLSKSNR